MDSSAISNEIVRAAAYLQFKRTRSHRPAVLKHSESYKKVNVTPESLKELLCSTAPFLYLSGRQIAYIIDNSSAEQYKQNSLILSTDENSPVFCGVILEGQAFATKIDDKSVEILVPGESFGEDSCLFSTKCYNIAATSEFCTILRIPKNIFMEITIPCSQFASMIARNLREKQNIFKWLDSFKNCISQSVQEQQVDVRKLLNCYRRMESSLHPLVDSPEIDISAWRYAIRRLPGEVTHTFIYYVTTVLPDIYKYPEVICSVSSGARARTIYRTMTGKNIVIMRELESDLSDFLSALCIHIIESKKLRAMISSPCALSTLFQGCLTELNLSDSLLRGLSDIWGDRLTEYLSHVLMHHEDYKIYVNVPNNSLSADPSERWASRLWRECQACLGLGGMSVVEAIEQGLTVDIIQGSTRIGVNLLSPYIYLNKNEIEEWFEGSNITLKSKYENKLDVIFAKSFYYFKAFPEKLKERYEMNLEYGIHRIDETEMTGVRIILVNVSKLDPNHMDPSVESNPRGLLHLVINIGYTFGKQSLDIIRCITMLFGNAIESFNIIGKAGGLVGNRSEILLADKFYDESTQMVTHTNPKDIDQDFLREMSGCEVHKGPMLTVSGTILQNSTLLRYYKDLNGCVGLEMEGCFFAQGIQQAIDNNYVHSEVASRFLYYISDLPLDSETNLAQEEYNVSWDEGIGAMNALTRYCFQLIFKNELSDPALASFKKEVSDFLSKVTTPVALVTSGGTDAPLEKSSIRSIEKLSSGSNGAAYAELLLEQGYTVVFFARKDSLLPYLRHFSQACLVNSDAGEINAALNKVRTSCEHGSLMIIYYESVEEYLKKLDYFAMLFKPLKRKGMFIMNAAVSDYMRATNKPTMKGVDKHVNLELVPVPKKLGILKTYSPFSYVVSFKLESDPDQLYEKCYQIMRQFGVNVVIGTVVENIDNELSIVSKNAIKNVTGGEIQRQLMEQLVAMHQAYIQEDSST